MGQEKPSRPWAGFGYVVIVLLALLVALFWLHPIGNFVSEPSGD